MGPSEVLSDQDFCPYRPHTRRRRLNRALEPRGRVKASSRLMPQNPNCVGHWSGTSRPALAHLVPRIAPDVLDDRHEGQGDIVMDLHYSIGEALGTDYFGLAMQEV